MPDLPYAPGDLVRNEEIVLHEMRSGEFRLVPRYRRSHHENRPVDRHRVHPELNPSQGIAKQVVHYGAAEVNLVDLGYLGLDELQTFLEAYGYRSYGLWDLESLGLRFGLLVAGA